MRAIISRTSNGAWVRFVYDKDDASGMSHDDMSFQFDPSTDDEHGIENLRGMLYELIDRMDWHGDRYARQRIRLSIEHGDKYTCSGCPMCNQKHEEGIKCE